MSIAQIALTEWWKWLFHYVSIHERTFLKDLVNADELIIGPEYIHTFLGPIVKEFFAVNSTIKIDYTIKG